MRLQQLHKTINAHSELANGISFQRCGDLFTCSDDQSIQRWSERGEALGKVCVLETSLSDLHCCPLGSRTQQQQQASADVIAVACTDGTLKLITSNGRLDKSVEAHNGAVLCVRWSPDGSAIATSGEDGQVKVWSKAGMLRSTVVEAEEPVYCIAWGGTADAASQILFGSGSNISIKTVEGGASGAPAATNSYLGSNRVNGSNSSSNRVLSWKAHEELVLKVDWNATTNLIVSGGEDCRYKVWDVFGRLLFQSSAWEHSITSVAWSPDGTLFAAGSFNCLALCDRQGWSYCQIRPPSGSLLGLCWSPDATKIAAVGGNGALVVAALLEVVAEDGQVAAVLLEERVIIVSDMSAETQERLEFRNPVIKMSLGFGHLVVCTSSRCHVYSTSNWNTPHIFDLKDQPQLVLQCERSFCLLDPSSGLQVLTYEGKQVCALKPQGLRPEGTRRQLISLSNDTLAIATGCSVRCYETAQGRLVGEVSHSLEIRAVTISQAGTATDRLLAVLDSNGDLYLVKPLAAQSSSTAKAPAVQTAPGSTANAGLITASGLVPQGGSQLQQRRLLKLAANVAGPAVWHDSAPMLAGIVDGQLVVWYHPAAAFIDPDLLTATRSTVGTGSSLGMGAALDLFAGSSLMMRRGDGARVFATIAPQPVLLHVLVLQGKWDKAVRLARFSYDRAVWACLAALSMAAGELATAEAAFVAMDAVDKLQFVLHLRDLAGGAGCSDPVVAAEIAIYAGQLEEAEAKLLKAGLVYRAIKLHTRLHNWQCALDLARKQKQHVDTVLMLRQRYLAGVGQAEVLPDFQALMKEVVIDEAAIKEAIKQDKAKEVQQRGAAHGARARHV